MEGGHWTAPRSSARAPYKKLSMEGSFASKTGFRALTLPEPRKPVMMVAGMRLSGGIIVSTPEHSSVVEAADAANLRRARHDGAPAVAVRGAAAAE